ncbi:hypothetical protein [Streptomyces sp. NPDC127036]|uniref:hypothetical protein n=1 Tax=Streptomyces sp. NPDC127036 TaxID=3347112 RepID=UPI00365B2B07
MDLGIIGQAAGVFAVTNIDDILILALFFAQGADHPGSTAGSCWAWLCPLLWALAHFP